MASKGKEKSAVAPTPDIKPKYSEVPNEGETQRKLNSTKTEAEVESNHINELLSIINDLKQP